MLTKTHTLVAVPQPFYNVGVSAKVNSGFPLHDARDSHTVVANLRPGSTATVLLWQAGDPNGKDTTKWYLVKSETNIVGWANEAALIAHMDLPWAG